MELSGRLARPNRVTIRAVLSGLVFAARPCERINGWAEFDIRETGSCYDRLPSCTRQGTRDSTGPKIDIAKRTFRDRLVDTNVRDQHSAAGTQHAGDFPADAELIRAQVDHAVADDDIGPTILDWDLLDVALTKLDVPKPILGTDAARPVEHLRRHVDADYAPLVTHVERRRERIHAPARTQIDDAITGPGRFPVERVRHPRKGLASLLRQPVKEGTRIAKANRVRAPRVEVVLAVRGLGDFAVLGLDLASQPVDVDQIEDLRHFAAILIRPGNIASMLASAARLIRRAEDLAARPDASEDDRLRSGLFLLMTVPATAAGALWGIGYTLLGRPLAGAIPGGFAIVVVAIAVTLWRRRRLGYIPFFFLLLILLLPALLQASLGGFVKGSAVVVWSFFAPLGAFVLYGSRSGWRWTAAFAAVVGISAIFDAALTRSATALPIAAQTALFAFNFCGVAASVTLVLAYFRIQRDEAMARSERLLLNVLPPEIAERLKRDEYPIADRFEDVTVLFADMAGFTVRSATESPEAMVKMLNEFLSAFDGLAQRHGLRPIRTTGDSYLVVGGLPIPRPDHAEAIADMALDMLQMVDLLNDRHGWSVKFRLGVNTGPTMAAVVGRHRFTYDVWSDAVNTASRMESTGVPGRIQVADETYRRLCTKYLFESRGPIDVKGKGTMTTYFLVGHKSAPDGQIDPNALARSAVEKITGPPELTRGAGSAPHVASGP